MEENAPKEAVRHNDFVKFLAGVALGFSLFTATSEYKSPIRQVHDIKIKNISYFPNIKIKNKDGSYHIHHWLIFAAIYTPLLLFERSSVRSKFIHGFFLGSIIQGLTYKDRFQVHYHS